MPLDIPAMLAIAQSDLKTFVEELNGLNNLKCAAKSEADKAIIQRDIEALEKWRSAMASFIAISEVIRALGYPNFLVFHVAMDVKTRIQKELHDSTLADSLFVGFKPAVSGVLNFGPTIPKP